MLRESLRSENGMDFVEELMKVIPFKIKGIQTDNGSEFAGNLERGLEKLEVLNFYPCPKDPQSNAYVERFGRTLEEHFVEWY